MKNISDLDNLFKNNDIEFISLLLENNSLYLNNIDNYKKLSIKLEETEEKINKLNKDFYNLFMDYTSTLSKLKDYEMCMIYYLGLKKGIEIKDLKDENSLL